MNLPNDLRKLGLLGIGGSTQPAGYSEMPFPDVIATRLVLWEMAVNRCNSGSVYVVVLSAQMSTLYYCQRERIY